MDSTKQIIIERLNTTIPLLSREQLAQVADYAEFLRSREEWEATMELLCDEGMRRDVEEGQEQASRGETFSWREIK